MKTNVYVFGGGKSVEHDVSLISATAIANSLDRDKYNVYRIYITYDGVWVDLGLTNDKIEEPQSWVRESGDKPGISIAKFLENYKYDEKGIALLALHGTNGEDGKIQGVFETAGIPYTGDGVLPSAVAMEKATMKDLFKCAGIPQTPYTYFNKFEYAKEKDSLIENAEKTIGYPMFTKPSNGGSSVGAMRVKDREELIEGIELAFKYDLTCIIEKEVIGREIQFSVIGNFEPKVSVPGEFEMERQFFDYNAKYIDKKIVPIAPARMTPETMKKMQKTAIDAYKSLHCNGLARVDFFILEDESYLVCEINTMPGFTSMSFTPVLWSHTDGTTYQGVVENLIKYGFEMYDIKKNISVHR